MEEKLQEMANAIVKNGPSRVVVSKQGVAVSPSRARADYGITPDVIFIRNDGWSLGAPKSLQSIAESTWPDEWIGVLRSPSTQAEPYVRS